MFRTCIVLVTIGLPFSLTGAAFACDLSSQSPWHATETELVGSTAEIFVGRVRGVRQAGNDALSSEREYEFEVLERIKGNPPDVVWAGGFGTVSLTPDPQSRGRIGYGSDCRMLGEFKVGGRYLVFRDSFHPKGYEELVVGSDPWVDNVRRVARLLATGARLPELCSDPPVASGSSGGKAASRSRQAAAASSPVVVNGLELVVRPTRATFAANEPLQMVITFRNRSAGRLRTPDRIEPQNTLLWVVSLEEIGSGRRCTGVSTVLPKQLRAGDISPVVLEPGEARSTTVSFQAFGFVDGDTSQGAASHLLRMRYARMPPAPSTTARGREFNVPAGTYRVRVTVQFPSFPTYWGVPDDVREETARLARDPVPMWNGDTIRSEAVDVTFAP